MFMKEKLLFILMIIFASCSKNNVDSINAEMSGKWAIRQQKYYSLVDSNYMSTFSLTVANDTFSIDLTRSGKFSFSYHPNFSWNSCIILFPFQTVCDTPYLGSPNLWNVENYNVLISNDSIMTFYPNYGQFLEFLYRDFYEGTNYNTAIIKNISQDSLVIYEKISNNTTTEYDSIFLSRIQ
jgi:hypothetical protein